ncbi:MAG TPA: hypothetical protein VK592_07680, partial [Candidatus Dormibacteraeota bacterium]|nr:hypothetical protein [Candidatus Dormibacteraeota bacterium]
DPDDLGRAVAAIMAELGRLRAEAVPQAELEKARNFARGRLELRLEEGRHLVSWLGVQEALHDRVLTLDEAIAELEAVTAADVQRVAGELFCDEALTLAVVAPAGAGADLEQALRLPA